MENITKRAVVTVRLNPSNQKGEVKKWNLHLRIYPVIKGGKATTVKESLHLAVTTPIWIKQKGTKRKCSKLKKVKRNVNGVIMCASEIDQQTCVIADKIRMQRQMEYDNADTLYLEEGITQTDSLDFIEYFKRCAAQRFPRYSEGTMERWKYCADIVKEYNGNKPLPFSKLDLRFVNGFREFVQKLKDKRYTHSRVISKTTSSMYFKLFRAALRRAYADGLLKEDLSSRTIAIPKEKKNKEILTREEINSLKNTVCDSDVLKRAAIFSALTGVRRTDLCRICWYQLKETDNGWRLDFMQHKTKIANYLPISEEAYKSCGTPAKPNDFIFPELGDKIKCNHEVLRKWLNNAGIYRDLTFHSFRHSYASLLLENNVDIEVIESMLGHININITQNYLHPNAALIRKAVESVVIPSLNTGNLNEEQG